MAALTLAADPTSPSTAKILATARIAGVQLQLAKESALTPAQQPIPKLHTLEGPVIRYTNPILRRLAQTAPECGLFGNNFFEESAIDSWLDWAALEVDHLCALEDPCKSICEVLEPHLKTRTFIVGQRMSVADVSIALSLKDAIDKAGRDKLREKYPAFVRWFNTVMHRPELGGPEGKPAAAPAKESAKAAPAAPAKPAAKPAAAKPAAAAPAASAGGAADQAAVDACGNEIRALKEKLKGEGLSGKKINDHPEVKALVEKLQTLKAGAGDAAPAPPAPAKPPPSPAAPAAEAPKEGAGAEGGGKKADKKAAKEEEKRKKEEEKKKKLEEQQAAAAEKLRGPDVRLNTMDKFTFGTLFVQSECKTGRDWTEIKNVGAKMKDKQIWIRARVANVRKQGGKLAFVTLRQRMETIQCVAFGNDIAGFSGGLADESVVDVFGKVSLPQEPIKSCTQSDVELQIEKIFCVSRAVPLPLQLADAARSEKEYEKDPTLVRVHQDVRLDNRILDMRTACNQGVFRIQSGVGMLFREYLLGQGFVEIHTPKMIAAASEGGADVFKLGYFDTHAYLAQSPQLYKQMALMGDLGRVFESGPVFRSEKSLTHRHMTEFTGLDLEMTFKDHYHEVLEVLDGMFNHIFTGLTTKFKDEIAAVKEQYPFEDFKWKHPCKRFTFEEAVKLLNEHGPKYVEKNLANAKNDNEVKVLKAHLESVKNHDIEEDIGTEDERILGKVIHDLYGEDFYIIDKFPKDVRPFYTMSDPFDPRWTNSYDLFMRGEEITSGAQRIHDVKMLEEKAAGLGIKISEGLQDYANAFKYGAYPHAGAGIGLERVVMLFLNLNNIRKTSMFPRDPKRLTP